MATLNGARALGKAGKIGELSPRALADLIAIPFQGQTAQAYQAVLAHTGPVPAGMIDGRWVIPPAS
jgi:cytosine/adenosine deaminase-related metal-dependent hydrolase